MLKLDSSSLLDVGVTTGEAAQETLALSRIREDRSPEDLLFQMLLETRIPLSDPIRTAEAKALNKWLYKNDYIDESDNVLQAWREARDAGTVPDLPASLEALKPFAEEVKRLVDSVRDPSAIRRFTQARGPKPLPTNKNFAKSEFQELWSRINHKAAYTVDFSSDELVQKAVKAIDREVDIPKLTYTVRKAVQADGRTFAPSVHESRQVDEHYMDTGVKYDLVGKVAEGTVLTRKTATAILKGILPSRFRQFGNNPEKFIAEVVRVITEQKATMVVVYAKLPGGFSIPTPMGGYNPDWAIAFKDGTVKHVFFVAETKGSLSEMQLREIEKGKIACARKFFAALGEKDTKYHVTYRKVASYADLMTSASSDAE